jgi:hypothetical protein
MTNQPNKEDKPINRQKVVDDSHDRFGQIGVYDRKWIIPGNELEKALEYILPDMPCHNADRQWIKRTITDYIQSNYILKSDVEGIIKQAKPEPLSGDKAMLEYDWIDYESKAYNMSINEYEQNLIRKASQYGLTIQ